MMTHKKALSLLLAMCPYASQVTIEQNITLVYYTLEEAFADANRREKEEKKRWRSGGLP
jgi:hypothetical protein